MAALAQTSMVLKAPAAQAVASNKAVASRVAAFNGKAISARMSPKVAAPKAGAMEISANLKVLRDRIESVKSTQKITDAMKLVAAAKVRRAQEAVLGGRPFSENLVKVLFAVNTRLQGEDVDVPLTAVRPVKKVLLVCCTGDRGLCGGFNNFVIKKTEARIAELKEMGIEATLVAVGKKGAQYFKRRPQYKLAKVFDMGGAPTTADAQAVADEIFSSFVSEEVDKVELMFTKFVSLINSQPTIQTLLPLTPEGEVCDVNGNCVDAANDEVFKLTSKDGAFAVERDTITTETASFEGTIVFEQDPNQILDALLPLYMNSQVLRAFQESVASELAARMNAMSNASDNAKDLKKNLSGVYNRKRQAKITGELIELVAGSSA
uniref:F-ATPase gamma subunit n=1 Tax=Pyramimonas obovata TaxID=1411642 RepID=A0A7S0MRR4_9CHLO|mmetsp:Transcript_11851/g.24911  ORF Transcript_11851/g.24911 Transcript_11851/m.24911 type:complete len:378 (+) Transcript_11851:81-1214(+)|eukprot:CAMPEP_0118921208 /NCGR_PEP_ID=MMETSP1169-20130426/557_1 /TAXON_ID=36882 /ORGANISM="Pyramimonas obovata, Strain CCMP722" /LENGTH=377 /DNA_ID=CAMNT_0006861893 /DNA_START=81 /DNA_END=1214 /DNA_ORIENTATION=-